jgi:type I restriction enzyme S subunit
MIETKISYGVNSSFELRRLKDFAKINKGKQLKEDEYFNGPYPYINGGMNPSGYINIYNNQGPFIAISEGGASAGYSQIFEGNVWVGAHCYVLKTNQNLKYVYYVLKGFEKEIMSRKTGSAMPNLQKSKFNNTLFPIIYNSYRQENIVKYLDKIDYILLKQMKKYNKKIDLLKEYKEALIYETVTKGLDKNVEMKDSGIDWIGKIPNTWNIKRVKNYFSCRKEKNSSGSRNVLSLTLSGVIKKDIESNKGLNPDSYDTYQLVNKNDLIFKLIDLANYKTSRVGLVTQNGVMSSAYIRLIIKSNNNILLNKYAFYFFYDLYTRGVFNNIGGGGVRSTLSTKDLLKIGIPIPEFNEQQEIVNFIENNIQRTNIEIDTLAKKVELIEELKESIIYECVTGKLDIEVDGEKYQKIIESI